MLKKIIKYARYFNPLNLTRVITLQKIERLIYYARQRQFGIILDRIKKQLPLLNIYKFEIKLIQADDYIPHINFEVSSSPRVSIIIPVYNKWEYTRACLTAIYKHTRGIPCEIIVADDKSTDETRNIKNYFSNILIVHNRQNLGFLKNCNTAAMQATGEYIVFLNNDTNVQPRWLEQLLAVVDLHQDVGLVGPMLLYPNGRLQEAGGIIWKSGEGWNYGCQDNHPERSEYNYVKETDYISGACILVKKYLWNELGGFDERFAPAYYEDTDLAFGIRKLGYKVVYQPQSRVVHFEGVSHGKDMSAGIKQFQNKNLTKFEEKWRSVLQTNHCNGPADLFIARDRILDRKILLFIDHYIPMPDRDAGSRSTYQYLKLMTEMGYRIKYIGDNYVGYQPYTSELQSWGIEVLYGRWYYHHWKKWLRENGKYIDYVYLSRPGIAPKYLPIVRKYTTAKVIYCGHDLHYLRMARKYEIDRRNENFRHMHKWEKIEKDIVKNVDISYFFSDFEVNELKKDLPDSRIRTIPLFLFNEKKVQDIEDSVTFENRQGLLFVGGFMHRPNVDAVLWFIKEILPFIRESLPEVEFNVVGSNPTKEILELAAKGVNVLGAITDKELQKLYRETRVVVAPLRYGAGVKGKIIESIERGVPVVTTKIGAEGIYSADDILAIADDPQHFAQHVTRLYSHFDLWIELVGKGLNVLQEYYTYDNAKSILSVDMPLK